MSYGDYCMTKNEIMTSYSNCWKKIWILMSTQYVLEFIVNVQTP